MKTLPYDRTSRIAGQIKELVIELCTYDAEDPRLAGINITDVRLTKDLQIARIYFHTEDGNENERITSILKGLNSAKGFIKRKIAEEINLRYTPELEFYFDEAIQRGKRIEELLEKIKT